MSKLIILVLIFLPIISFSQEEIDTGPRLQGSKELPKELNLLIQTLQNSGSLTQECQQNILKIDSYARLLSKEDIFLVGKIEIYKTLLKSNMSKSTLGLDGSSLTTLKEAIKKSKDPFVQWFLQGLLHDIDALISSSLYKDYTLQKNNGKLEKIEYRKIDKKIQILGRWLTLIKPDSPDFENTLTAELHPILNEVLRNIEQAYFLLARNSTSEKISISDSIKELKFFSVKEMKVQKKTTAQKEKSVEDILAPITEESAPTENNLPEPSKEDWLNQDNAPANLKNLPKPSDDADWLQDI